MMKPLLMAVVSVLCIATPAFAAEFEGVIEMKITATGMGANGTGKTYVSKVGWRSEMEVSQPMMQANGGKPFKTLMFAKRAEADSIYVLNEATKSYAILNAKEMRERGAAAEPGDKKYSVKRLGKDKVAGWACEKIEVTEEGGNQQIEACISKEIMAGDWARTLQSDGRGAKWMKAVNAAGVEGFPLRMVSKMKDTPDSQQTMEVTKVERRAVPDSMFEVPAGFSKTSPMGAFAQNPEQAKKMEQAQEQMQKAMQNMSPEQRKMFEEMMKRQQPAPTK